MQRRGRSIRSSCLLSLFVSTLSCLLMLGCTSIPKLKPAFPLAAEQEKIQKTIGVFYAPEFRGYKHVADPYHNKHNVEFLIGSASVELFRSVFSHSFEKVKELEEIPAPERVELEGMDAIIEPKIGSFNFHSRMAGHRTYWADITYEIALTRPGNFPATWQIRGTGEGSGDSLFNEERSWANPVELAMVDAAKQLAASFHETPEAVRWLRGMPLNGATASMESQRPCTVQIQSSSLAGVCYQGIVSAQARFNMEADPAVEKAQATLKEKGLLAVGLYLKNEGHHTLRVRRSNISLANRERQAVGPMPCSFFAAAATAYNVRLPQIIGGTGYAAIPQLIFSLMNLAVTHEEEKELGNYSATFKKYEFADAFLKEGDTVKGALFFAFAPADLSTTDLCLTVPVVDLDSATRYVLRVPVK
jgi:hypothetical protein